MAAERGVQVSRRSQPLISLSTVLVQAPTQTWTCADGRTCGRGVIFIVGACARMGWVEGWGVAGAGEQKMRKKSKACIPFGLHPTALGWLRSFEGFWWTRRTMTRPARPATAGNTCWATSGKVRSLENTDPVVKQGKRHGWKHSSSITGWHHGCLLRVVHLALCIPFPNSRNARPLTRSVASSTALFACWEPAIECPWAAFFWVWWVGERALDDITASLAVSQRAKIGI